MTDKRSKYDTDPLDPDFVRRTDEMRGETGRAARDAGEPYPQPIAGDPTRRFDEQMSDTYPSVFVPPAYQPPQQQPPPQPQPQQQSQPYSTFGAEPHQPPATTGAPMPGPSSPYHAGEGPSSRPVTNLGIPENFANALPYAPFYIGLVVSIIELLIVPRHETRTRFHAAQGLALQFAILAGTVIFGLIQAITGSRLGGNIFWLASFIFLLVSGIRVLQGKPHHIAPLDDATRALNERVNPLK
ncbi:MAG: hypothetical protein H0T60_15705 [Acidobacteria bacterium]|nr:hypothetical protein [Acidobacteriota bacterium]